MSTNRIVSRVLLIVVVGGLLAACAGPGAGPMEPTEPMATEEMATEAPVATEEPTPTEAPMATEEMIPAEEPTATEEPMATEEMATEEPMEPMTGWQADGAISDSEYEHEATVGEVRLWWRNDAEFLYLAMEAPTTGWVAVGLAPENRMQGANFIFGAVADGEAQIWDAYGTAPTGNAHPPDEELGGTNDVFDYAGVEEDGVTRFEVQIPLDSGDEFDKALEAGQTYPVIAAVGPSDAFDALHTSRAGGSITLD